MASWLKRNIIRPVRDKFLYIMAGFLFWITPLLPRKLLLLQNGGLSGIVYRFSKQSSASLEANLKKVYGPEREKGEYRKIGKRVFKNLALTFTDYAIWGKRCSWDFFSRYFNVSGQEYLQEAYKQGKGVICLIPHTVAWEFSALVPPLLGYKTTWVTSRIKNPALGMLLLKHRESRGAHVVIRYHCYDTLVEKLRNGECVIMMTDQDSKHVRGEFIDFMGFPAYTPIGCSRLAADTGAAVVPMCTIRTDDDKYNFTIYPPLPRLCLPDGSYDIIANTKLQNDVFGRMILEHPDQWVWFHERWNTTPESLERYLKSRSLS